jgi:hypothetical protein
MPSTFCAKNDDRNQTGSKLSGSNKYIDNYKIAIRGQVAEKIPPLKKFIIVNQT